MNLARLRADGTRKAKLLVSGRTPVGAILSGTTLIFTNYNNQLNNLSAGQNPFFSTDSKTGKISKLSLYLSEPSVRFNKICHELVTEAKIIYDQKFLRLRMGPEIKIV